jgi:hypothetical protein
MEIKLLLPFPAAPPGVHKEWEFVRVLEPNLAKPKLDPIRVNAYDVSETFDRILSITDNGNKYAEFAPYGPKTMSLAMCIYASQTESAVYYTQPRSYNPQYSSGVKLVKGKPQVLAYCLRLNGRKLY